MKNVFFAMMILISFKAQAFCPTEEVCYSLDSSNSSRKTSSDLFTPPAFICLELLYVNPENESIGVVSSTSQPLFLGLTIDSLTAVDHGSYDFIASGFLQSWEAKIVIKGTVSFSGSSQLNELDISIKKEMINREDPSLSFTKVYKYLSHQSGPKSSYLP